MVSAVDMAGPYLAVLSILKLVLLILVITELAKALGKSGGEERDSGDEPTTRRNPEELENIELEIVAPAAPARSTNEAAKIPRKVDKFIAKSTKIDIPPRCRHVWFITTTHNQIGLYDVLTPNHGVFYGIGGNRNLVILKNIKISDKIPSNEEVGLHVRLLTPNRKKVLGEAYRKIMIVDGPGTGPGPQPKPPRGNKKPFVLKTLRQRIADILVSPSSFTDKVINNPKRVRRSFNYFSLVIDEMDRIAKIINERRFTNQEEGRKFLEIYTPARPLCTRYNNFSGQALQNLKVEVATVLHNRGITETGGPTRISGDPNWRPRAMEGAERDIIMIQANLENCLRLIEAFGVWWDKNHNNIPE